MKFKKILTIELPPFKLEKKYWNKIDQIADNRINLAKDSPGIIPQLRDTDCLLTGFGIKVGKEEIDNAAKLKYVGVLATGYGGVDTTYAKRKNVVVTNVPGYATESVAEFVFAVILEHMRSLERGKNQARNKNYSEAGFSAIEIKGKVFGIVGLGRIGTRVAELARCFGADIIYWSRNKKSAKNIKFEDAEKVISRSDILSLHLSLCKDTKNFLNKGRIAGIKGGAIVVNTAPMELVDLNALEKRLAIGDITFILDHADEMTAQDLKRLSRHKNCIIYPPIGYITKEASVIKQEIFVQNIENFLKGKPSNRVD